MDKDKKKKTSPKAGKKKIKKEKNNYFSSFNFALDLARVFLLVSILFFLVLSFLFAKLQTGDVSEQDLSYFNEPEVVKISEKAFGSLKIQSQSEGAYELHSLDFDEMIDIAIPVLYNYVYTGEDFDLFAEKELVYRRLKPVASNFPLESFFRSGETLVDLSGFRNLSVSSLNLIQDTEFGYSFNFGLEDGYFSLYKNWKRWPSLEKVCGSEDNFYCFEDYKLSEADALSDLEILKISDDFLKRYSIKMDNFGEGVVQSHYQASEIVNVIYPLEIDNMTVYEEYGNLNGLNIEVSVREKRVSGLYNLYNQQYEASYYQTETDKDLIIKMAERGGDQYFYTYEEDEDLEFVNIEIGTPKIGLSKIWIYDDITKDSYELYAPAYIFPIDKSSSDVNIYQDNIVVPAVKDFFNRYDHLLSPRILPLM